MTRPGLVPVSGRSLGLSSPEPELSAPHRSPGQARVGWQDGGTQLSVPGIATIASVATTMARVAADTNLCNVSPFMLLLESAYNDTH